MVGELDALINDMSASLVELKKLEEKKKKESSELKNIEETIKSIKNEFHDTNLEENKLTRKRFDTRISVLEAQKNENKEKEDKINELKNQLNEKYEAFRSEYDRKISLRKQNFEDFFVLSEEGKERRKEQIKVLEDSISRDEANGVNPDAEYLVNRKKLLEDYKASLDEENREKDLDKFIELEKVFKSDADVETKINNLNSLVGKYKETNKNNKTIAKPVEKTAEKATSEKSKSFEGYSVNVPQKSFWTKLKEGFIKGWKFIKEYVSGLVKKGKNLLAERKNKQLGAGKSLDVDEHNLNEEIENKIDRESKTDFKASLEVSPEVKEELKEISTPKRDVSDRVKEIKENLAKKENDIETEKTEEEKER